MSSSLRELLVDSLASHMRGLPEQSARCLAHDLTCRISAHIGNLPSPDDHGVDIPCFPREAWNGYTLGIPWEAFQAAFLKAGGMVKHDEVKPLCSAPSQLDPLLTRQARESGLWGGSLLVALGRILGSARQDLAIFSPYWRTSGVQSLVSTANRSDYSGLLVRIFTQASYRMESDDRTGLIYFVDKMRALGASVRVYSPRGVDGVTPFLHAKLLVADRNQAYVGSANFTASGFEHAIEAGALLNGKSAASFGLWSEAVESACEPWQTNG